MSFVSLHNHTYYSILSALPSPKDYFLRAKELDQKALAITDYGTLSSLWDALKASKETGVKLIAGCEYYFVNDVNNKDTKLRFLILLAKNQIGYRNILLLNSNGFNNSSLIGKRVFPIIDWNMLKKHCDGLICLTACGNGIIGQLLNNKKFDEAEDTLLKLKDIFGDNLGVEVQTHNLIRNATYYTDSVNQVFTNTHLIRLANKHDVRIVPTNNSFYLRKEDAEVHDVMLAIGSMQPVYSNARTKYDTSDLYLKSFDEVKAFFARNHTEEFAEKICANSVYFADLCEKPEWIDPKFSNPSGKELPLFPVEQESDFDEFKEWLSSREDERKIDIDKSYLRYKCNIALSKKVPADKYKEYRDRLNEELEVMEFHGFSSYMLIVADYMNWANKNKIRTSVGRGSCGGSLVAYLLGIHGADPIKYKLIFARFLNKDRTSFPDIDEDFSPSGRDKVQDYIRNKYGSDHVAHVSNINTITPKVYARDICRSCDLAGDRALSVQLGNEIADSIPKKTEESEIRSFDEAISKCPLFFERVKQYPQLEKYSKICGKYRAWATHAAGLIISKRPLPGLFPLRKDKDGAVSVELDKDRAEENGLIKMDTLGLETLDIIDETYRLIKIAGKQLPSDPPDFDEYDKPTYDLIARGDTFCVFQLGISSGTIDLCRKVKPTTIEDISHINALARPSARDIREDFVLAKEGKKKVKLLHPSLKRAFEFTFGCGLYEESLMYLAQDVAGWSLHSADRLRKLTKEKGKNPKKALQWRTEFIDDSKKNGIAENISMQIWDDIISNFTGYGFNFSHSILYSMTSYHTAYLKAHYPVEFLLANLMSELRSAAKQAKENIEKIKQELRNHNIKILPPNINTSELDYKVQSDGSLLTGLGALKFVGDDAIAEIIKKRPFKDFDDFMLRVDSSVRSNTIQALAACGCLDHFDIPRKSIYLYCQDYRKKLTSWLKRHDPNTEQFKYNWPIEKNWTMPELYALEKSYLGEAFVCDKTQAYVNFFNKFSTSFADIKQMHDKERIPSVRVLIKSVFEFKVKKETSKLLGQNMIKATVEDAKGDFISLTIFPNQWKDVKARIKDICGNKYKFEPGIAINFTGSVNLYEDEIGIVLENLFDICPPPAPPKDLKAKKTISTRAKKNEEILDINVNNTDEMVENIEDYLFDEGLIELEEDPID